MALLLITGDQGDKMKTIKVSMMSLYLSWCCSLSSFCWNFFLSFFYDRSRFLCLNVTLYVHSSIIFSLSLYIIWYVILSFSPIIFLYLFLFVILKFFLNLYHSIISLWYSFLSRYFSLNRFYLFIYSNISPGCPFNNKLVSHGALGIKHNNTETYTSNK